MNKIILVVCILVVATVVMFPKDYYTYQGINPDPNWKPERCAGISKAILYPNPDGADRVCLGIIF